MYVKNFGSGPQWLPGRAAEISGSVLYHVQIEDGRQRHCHQDHLCTRVVEDDVIDTTAQAVPENIIPVGVTTLTATFEMATSEQSGSSSETGPTVKHTETTEGSDNNCLVRLEGIRIHGGIGDHGNISNLELHEHLCIHSLSLFISLCVRVIFISQGGLL